MIIMSSMKEKLVEWLQKFGIQEDAIRLPSEEEIQNAPEDYQDWMRDLVVVPYRFKLQDSNEEIILHAQIITKGKWIQVKALLLESGNIAKNMREYLFRLMLVANFELNEVTYSISSDGDVFVETDMPVDTTYENFDSEYGSIEFGAHYFFTEILPKAKESINARNTWDPKRSFYL